MSRLGDRLLMTLIAGTALAGLIGYVVTSLVAMGTDWYMRYTLPILLALIFFVSLFAIWEGLESME